MKIYHYHPETKEFLQETNARQSPLEPGVFLIPASATSIIPPSTTENEVAVFSDGTWAIQPDFRGLWFNVRERVEVAEIGPLPEGYTAEPVPLSAEEILEGEKRRIAADRYAMETSGVTIDGMIFPTDRESVQILDSTVEKIRRGLVPSVIWKCENGWVELNETNIDAIEIAILTHVQTAFMWEKSEVEKLI